MLWVIKNNLWVNIYIFVLINMFINIKLKKLCWLDFLKE